MDNQTMEVVGAEATTPDTAAENVAETAAADTQPNDVAEETTEVTTPDDESAAEGAQPETNTEQETASPFSLPVRFNHKSHQLTAEQATAYAQMGMKYEAEAGLRDKLRRLASGTGKTVEEMVDMLTESQDKLLRQQLLERCNGDQEKADLLMEKEIARRNAAYDEATRQRIAADEKEEKDFTDRMAEQFVELQKEFPELEAFDSLPRSVVDLAAQKDISLLDAYLRHRLKEDRRVDQNRAAAAVASKAGIGSQSGQTASEEDPAIVALRNSIRNAI